VLANLIKSEVRTPDIYVSADPSVNKTLQGPANGNIVSGTGPELCPLTCGRRAYCRHDGPPP